MDEVTIFTVMLLGLLYLRYYNDIYQWIKHPHFALYAVCVAFLALWAYIALGFTWERLRNKINMWRLGIKRATQITKLTHSFREFDLEKELKSISQEGTDTFLGLNAETKRREQVLIPDEQRTKHLQIIGMTGTGKTESVFMPLIYQDVLKGRPVVIIDAKGEIGPIERLNALMKRLGREDDFLLFSLAYKEMSCSYNPLYVGECDPQVVIDAFLSNFHDDNSFYRETARNIFTNAFYILHSLEKPFTPMDVYTYLTDTKAFNAVNEKVSRGNTSGALYLKLLQQLITTLTAQYKGWKHVVTGFNNYLLGYKDEILNDDDSDIILTDVLRKRQVVYFQLPTNAYPIKAVGIARIVQANLRYISSLIQIGKMPKDILVSVIIDEYGAFAEESFIEVLNKARSSGMMVTLAHQSLSDLTAISPEFMKRIDENTLNKIYFKQTDPDLCELVARSLGTREKEEKTYRMEGGKFGTQLHIGETSNRIVNEFNFHPDRIKNLHHVGQGYYIYRGDINKTCCVNFGYFKNIESVPYTKKDKPHKQEGLRLFEDYYLKQQDDKADKELVAATPAGKPTEKYPSPESFFDD
ncbi:MAG: type IV secretion system DNA-binding domain-containing protein [Candidatus Omnitrophica bacterium]|nr:type IV secretion system DNA-binding domain-containing protein [Candidatus Omnitrophota bacterium]